VDRETARQLAAHGRKAKALSAIIARSQTVEIARTEAANGPMY